MKNTKSKIYQYAVLWHPTEEQFDAGERSKFITDITTVIALDEGQATKTAFMNIPIYYRDQLEQIDVVVRPF